MNGQDEIRAKSGANHGGAYAHNRRVIIEALRVNGQLSRAALARATHLTAQTVSNIIADLEADGLVRSEAAVRQGRGQPSVPYNLVSDGAYAIGVQIDRHATRAVAVDLVGDALVKLEAPLPPGGPANGVDVVTSLVDEVRRQLITLVPRAQQRLVGLGVAMPGPFGLRRVDGDPWMMAEWQDFPLLDTLANGTGLEVSLQNDALAAATAEKLSGAARRLDHAVYLFFGYGLGAGIIANGEIYAGANGNAGEIGMVLTPPFTTTAAPIEHACSMASLCRVLALDPAASDLFDRVEAALAERHQRLETWIMEAGNRLRWAVQLVETLFDPQTVVLGGQMPPALLKRLFQEIAPLLPSQADRPDRTSPRLVPGIADPWIVALGAAAEPISRAFQPRYAAVLIESRSA